jgi:hypothetical protein
MIMIDDVEVRLKLQRAGYDPDKGRVSGTGVFIGTGSTSDGWTYRVELPSSTRTPRQAVVGFSKFGTIGIGFQYEDEDWNSNLPYGTPAAAIFAHICHNLGKDTVPANEAVAAIELVRAAAIMDMKDSDVKLQRSAMSRLHDRTVLVASKDIPVGDVVLYGHTRKHRPDTAVIDIGEITARVEDG